MFYDTTLTARTQDSVPYIRLEADHDFRNLVARLLSALGGRRHASTARSLTSSPALSICPPPVESAPLVLDRRGRLYVSHDEILHRLRFYAAEEWAALPCDGRPVASSYDPRLGCWAGLEPVPHLNN